MDFLETLGWPEFSRERWGEVAAVPPAFNGLSRDSPARILDRQDPQPIGGAVKNAL